MKKRGILLGIILVVVCVAGAIGYVTLYNRNNSLPQESGGLPAGTEPEEGVVVSTGVTSAELAETELELDFLETELMVEEVYVSSSDEVTEGTKILKITDHSLQEAMRELERARMDASLAYRQGVIAYETGLLEAENTKRKSQIASEFAQTVYEDTIAKAEAEVTKAQQEAKQAQELEAEYTAALKEGFYETEYEVAEKKAAYEKNVALFFEKLDAYGYELDDDGDDDPNTFEIVKKGKGAGGGNPDHDGEATVLQLLKNEYQENKEEYDQALEDCEAATEKARAGISQARDQVQAALLNLQEAQISLEKTRISAQADYDECVVRGEKAQAVYETTLKSLGEELDALAEAEEEAAERYERFVEVLGDGYITAKSDGTILMVRAREHTALAVDGVLLAYSDENRIRVTASVDQADIAQIAVGDVAAMAAEGCDTCTGVVVQIDPVSVSEGKASVSYQVTLEPDGSSLPANLSAVVYFGMTGEEYDQKYGAWKKGGEE